MPERRALVRDGGAHDQLELRILEDLPLAAGELRLREPLGEGRGQVRLLRVERDELAAARA